MKDSIMTTSERRVLQAFRKFQVVPGQMLCFNGPDFERNKAALQQLTADSMLVKERFKGGYSLTHAGFAAMKKCE
jgi:hypothetical protein